MTIHSTTKCSVLKVAKAGKYVTVWKSKDGVKLCAQDSQTEILVHIDTQHINNKNQMAFCFHHKGGGYYRLKVGKTGMNLEQIVCNPSESPSSDEDWFERVQQTVGDNFHLRSVGDSSKYLSLDAKEEKLIVCHSDMNENGLFTCYSKA